MPPPNTLLANLPTLPILPEPSDNSPLIRRVQGHDHTGTRQHYAVVTEQPLTIFLNATEIVTGMTVGDHPQALAIGFLLNQAIITPDDHITAIDSEPDIHTVVVRTAAQSHYEHKHARRIRTSGCAQGTVFADIIDTFDQRTLANTNARLTTSVLGRLLHSVNTLPSLYLHAGAIHGCALATSDGTILIYTEDVGRHNAVDKIAGFMHLLNIPPGDKLFYTTGRLTSEMIIKTVCMGLPILISRSGFTAWGVELAQQANLTLIGRARGKRFVTLAGAQRIVHDL